MSSKTWDAENHYYSGQGIVLLGRRDTLGKPKGLLPLGNVSALKLGLATSVLEHKESQTGQRAVDLRLTTETKSSLSMTLENFNANNLATVLRGDVTAKAAGSVTAEAHKAYLGKVTPLNNLGATSIVVTMNSIVLTQYANDTTAYDYKVNEDAGSILFNDGAVAACGLAKIGHVPTAITPGVASCALTMTHAFVGGEIVTLRGLTGASKALMEGLPFVVASVTGTTAFVLTVPGLNSEVITVAATSYATWEGMTFTAAYTRVAQNQIDAMMEGTPELYMRFEGLNTAETNAPVVVEVFKFTSDPLKELSLIGDTIGQFVLEGSVLSDPLQTSGSKFFKQIMLAE
jgi:hypothetical protein